MIETSVEERFVSLTR